MSTSSIYILGDERKRSENQVYQCVTHTEFEEENRIAVTL